MSERTASNPVVAHTANVPVERGNIDHDGFLGPLENGTGPRRSPAGDFPTGPPIGSPLPPIVATDHRGDTLDIHADRAGAPAAVLFFRSAVW